MPRDGGPLARPAGGPPAAPASRRPGDGAGFTQSFPATPAHVRQAVRAAIARFARRIGPEDAGALELVLAEVLNNVVEHAYGSRGGAEGRIGLFIRLEAQGLRCLIWDKGRPMPAGRIPAGAPPDIGLDVAALPEGGFGWSIIRQLVSTPRYRRAAGVNLLRFVLPVGV